MRKNIHSSSTHVQHTRGVADTRTGRTLQSSSHPWHARAPLHFGNATLFFPSPSVLRFSVCPPFVCACLSLRSGVQRALRLAGIPEFARGRTFERSSVKKSAAPLEKQRCRGIFYSFYYYIVASALRWRLGVERACSLVPLENAPQYASCVSTRRITRRVPFGSVEFNIE